MIEGIKIRCNVGPFEVLRTPRLTLSFRRRAVVSRVEIDLPDPDGSIRAGLAVAQTVRVRFGHRCSLNIPKAQAVRLIHFPGPLI